MSSAADRLAIRDLVENWAVWRDSGDWERFRTVWHADGRMIAAGCDLNGHLVPRQVAPSRISIAGARSDGVVDQVLAGDRML